MDLVAVANEIADRLNGLDNLHVYWYVPDQPIVPCVVIEVDSFVYHDAYGEAENPQFRITLLAGSVSTESAQQQLFAWLSSSQTGSIIDVLEDPTDATINLQVINLRQWGTISLQDGGTRYYSAQIIVDVLVD